MVQKSLLIKAARSARAGGRDHGSDRNKSAVCVSVSRARAEHAVYAPRPLAHRSVRPFVAGGHRPAGVDVGSDPGARTRWRCLVHAPADRQSNSTACRSLLLLRLDSDCRHSASTRTYPLQGHPVLRSIHHSFKKISRVHRMFKNIYRQLQRL